ncbi:MAG TPA: TadE family protein [Caulifigura sp.]|nr:TadE family protein [Caulifigura sp.]
MHRVRFTTASSNKSSRQGLAAVELAICLPLMVMLTFGAVEAANAIYLKQMLVTAAYEAARSSTALGATQADGEARYTQIISSVGIKNSTITFTPPITDATPAGAAIKVTVSAPADSNSFSIKRFFKGTTLKGVVTMPRL